MLWKEVLIALGAASGAALLTLSAPSYSQTVQPADVTTIQMDEQVQQDSAAPADEPARAESEAESTPGVAGRRAEGMADENPAEPSLTIDEDTPREQ